MKIEQINKEYEKLCTQLGDVDYKIKQHEELRKSLYTQIDKLNELAATLQQAEQQESELKE